ncbi:MAG: purine-binding chemotaxis protein CheW [Syntrophomonadaceae bacterium]|nr:purine-binding chemotaxis protein CheW [Syntrophomonadaceae bacterium]
MTLSDTFNKDTQIVAFNLGTNLFGVDILTVQEIIKVLSITRVPKVGRSIEGVINLRGNVIPIFNLHKRFGITPTEDNNDHRIIVFYFDDIRAGIIVDAVAEVLKIDQDQIEDAGNIYNGIESDFIKGVGKVDDRLMLLLDFRKLFGLT